MYCYYCGRVIHRCQCGEANSPLQKFLTIVEANYQPRLLETPYKRGVPPQIKRRERQTLRKNYQLWYRKLIADYGKNCLHCGVTENLVIDHIVPIAKGGLSEFENLQLLCTTCNRIKGKFVFDCR